MLVGAALGLGVLACSDRPSQDAFDHPSHAELQEQPFGRPLTLEASFSRQESLPAETLSLVEFPASITEWSPTGRWCDLRDTEQGRELFTRKSNEDLLLRIPGDFSSSRLNLLRLRGHFPGPFQVTIALKAGTGKDYRAPALQTLNQEESQVLDFDLSALVSHKARFDQLFIHVRHAGRKAFELQAIEAISRPRHLFLPSPGETPLAVRAGPWSRPAVGLISARGASARADALEDMRFSCALLNHCDLGARAGQSLVSVQLSSATGPRETLTAELPDAQAQWIELECDLSPWAGSSVDITFSVENVDDPGAVVALAGVEVWKPMDAPPCVLLVSSDTHRADHLGVAEAGVQIQTPHLDSVATSGLLFEQCWSSTNVTSPSHTALMTGTHPRDTRLVTNYDRLSSAADTLAEAYSAAGWASLAAVSVGHLGPRGTDLGQGFGSTLAPGQLPWPAERAVGAAVEWMDAHPRRALFVFVHLFDAHHPYKPPASHDRMYYPAGKDPADPALPAIDLVAPFMPQNYVDMGLRDLNYPRSQYKAEISYLDSELAPLLEHDRVRAGLVAITADHGEVLVKDGSHFNHGELFPDTLHVPLVLGGRLLPSEFQGRRTSTPVSHLHLGRTLLDLSGLVATTFPGTNLLRELDTEDPPIPDLFALSAHGLSASLRRGQWFGLLHLRTHQGTLTRERKANTFELYDLDKDPECLADLSASQAERAGELRSALIDWLDRARQGGFSTHRQASAAEAAQLQALGYASGEAAIGDNPWYDPDRE